MKPSHEVVLVDTVVLYIVFLSQCRDIRNPSKNPQLDLISKNVHI
jgi:hypothetical protein